MALSGWWPRELFDCAAVTGNGSHERVSIRALPMGWISAVGICQHAHRNMLKREFTICGSPKLVELEEALQMYRGQEHLDFSGEVRRDRSLPMRQTGGARSAFQIYIDNFDEYEVISVQQSNELCGSESPSAQRTEAPVEFRTPLSHLGRLYAWPRA